MSKHQKTFQLTIRHIDLIEDALRDKIGRLTHIAVTDGAGAPPAENDALVHELNELLGSLHNQKIFYSQVNRTGVPAG